jgi:hypothetical protein
MRPFFAFTLSFLLGLQVAQAALLACRHAQVEPIEGIDPDAVEQTILWEETSNTARWAKPTEPVYLILAEAAPETVIVRTTQKPGSVATMVQGAIGILWPKHPWNTTSTVPHFNDSIGKTWKARFSASRSMFVYTPAGDLYSFKTPTNRPHSTKIVGTSQSPTKADLKNSVIISNRRSQMIEKIQQAHHQKDRDFDILLDVLTVADVASGNGYVVRDLRQLQDGYYYLPAFSVPYAGRKIAQHLKVEFGPLWQQYWAELLGKSKAKLLLHYGLQMKTPNAQNMLIQLDRNLKPTGKMLFRDISDSALVGPVAEGLGLSKNLQLDRDSNFTILEELKPYWENSVWQMDEGGVDAATGTRWGYAHDKIYISTIVTELRRTPTGQATFPELIASISDLQRILFSAEGKQALREYRRMTTRPVTSTQSVYDP